MSKCIEMTSLEVRWKAVDDEIELSVNPSKKYSLKKLKKIFFLIFKKFSKNFFKKNFQLAAFLITQPAQTCHQFKHKKTTQ